MFSLSCKKVMIGISLLCCSLSAFTAEGKKSSDVQRKSSLKNYRFGPGVIDIDASARLRGEYFNNRSLKIPGAGDDDDLLYSRASVCLRYRFDSGLSFFAEGYDARMFFNEFEATDFKPSCFHENSFDLARAYLEYRYRLTNPLEVSEVKTLAGVRAGRQRFSFADQRVWSKGLWANSYKYRWDGVRAFFKTRLISMDLLWGRRLQVDPVAFDDRYFDFDAVGLYLRTMLLKPIILDFFYVGKYRSGYAVTGERGDGMLAVTTLGVHGKGDIGVVTIEGTGAGQTGRYGTDKVVAGGLSLTAAYPLKLPLRPLLTAGYTVGSGDDDPTDGVHGTFDGLFGSAAKNYGRMNLFYWPNLHDIEAGCTIAPVNKTKLSFSYHYFLLASATDGWYGTGGKLQRRSDGTPRRDKTGNAGSELAHEIDIVATTSIIPLTKIIMGFGFCIPGEFIRTTALATAEKEPMRSLFFQVELVY